MPMNLLLRCSDLEETRAFYAEVLKFDVSGDGEGCTVSKAGGTILFTTADLWGGARPNCTGTVYFFVPDVDAYYETVRHKADVQWPIEDMSYGIREFGVKDCNGYFLAFAKRL